ncbi:MAG TPA: BatA domain-containing protein [Verrucomicrobiae bacterium]
MTFLQPEILWALPLVLLPIIIHLINRLRHRPQPWAAMRFLVAATQSSTSQAKLKQWLILLFRTLAVLMLILFLGRPLAGGWLGWSVNSAPDAIVILLDRSVSMESKLTGSTTTRREQALSSLAKAAEPFAGRSQLVVIDSALRRAQPLARPSDLKDLPTTAATDTTTDFPGLFQAALTWLEENQTGTAELWVTSDFQKTNWKADDERWQAIQAQLNSLQQRVRLRVLAVSGESDADTTVTLQDALRTDRDDKAELLLTADIQRSSNQSTTIPVTVNLNGTPSQFEVAVEGGNLRWRQRLALGAQRGSGWGYVEVPADANLHNNRAWFVYGPPAKLRTTIVTEEGRLGRWLAAASSASPPGTQREARVLSTADAAGQTFDGDVLIFWHAALPTSDVAVKLDAFVQSGGALVFLPTGKADSGQFAGQGWGAVEKVAENQSYQVERWEEKEGPLAKTEEGFSLPLNQASILQRQRINGNVPALASFADGSIFLTRQTIGRGQVYFLASLPLRDWSTLGSGPVLVPVTQRLLQSGSRRLTQASLMQCGDLTAVDQALPWQPVEGGGANPQLEAGIYRAGERLTAMNRASGEDSTEAATREEVTGALSGINLQWFEETGQGEDRLQGEVWRLFVTAMLLFLLIESFLVLPTKTVKTDTLTGKSVKPQRNTSAEVVS